MTISKRCMRFVLIICIAAMCLMFTACGAERMDAGKTAPTTQMVTTPEETRNEKTSQSKSEEGLLPNGA